MLGIRYILLLGVVVLLPHTSSLSPSGQHLYLWYVTPCCGRGREGYCKRAPPPTQPPYPACASGRAGTHPEVFGFVRRLWVAARATGARIGATHPAVGPNPKEPRTRALGIIIARAKVIPAIAPELVPDTRLCKCAVCDGSELVVIEEALSACLGNVAEASPAVAAVINEFHRNAHVHAVVWPVRVRLAVHTPVGLPCTLGVSGGLEVQLEMRSNPERQK